MTVRPTMKYNQRCEQSIDLGPILEMVDGDVLFQATNSTKYESAYVMVGLTARSAPNLVVQCVPRDCQGSAVQLGRGGRLWPNCFVHRHVCIGTFALTTSYFTLNNQRLRTLFVSFLMASQLLPLGEISLFRVNQSILGAENSSPRIDRQVRGLKNMGDNEGRHG